MDLLGEDLIEEFTILFPKVGEPRLLACKPDEWTPELIATIAQGGINAIVSWARLFGVVIQGTIGPPPGMIPPGAVSRPVPPPVMAPR